MRALVTFLFVSIAAVAQPVSFGVRGGVSLTGAFSSANGASSGSEEYLIGPMVELHLPFGLAVEGDALYHPLNLTQQNYNGSGYSKTTMSINDWEFPILAKYHFLPLPIVKPYVEAGPAFRDVNPVASYLSTTGIDMGAGVEVKLRRLRVEPDLRYIHWGADRTLLFGPGPVSNQNQVQLSVGIAY